MNAESRGFQTRRRLSARPNCSERSCDDSHPPRFTPRDAGTAQQQQQQQQQQQAARDKYCHSPRVPTGCCMKGCCYLKHTSPPARQSRPPQSAKALGPCSPERSPATGVSAPHTHAAAGRLLFLIHPTAASSSTSSSPPSPRRLPPQRAPLPVLLAVSAAPLWPTSTTRPGALPHTLLPWSGPPLTHSKHLISPPGQLDIP
ncbi:hypothetical protein P154DRAFT_306086 [Amniculicola lignicola CBS 123094]|uniref:Uncharacterized protein n=1 Tax=Amniculicola lignicola CBS 123094 TaxID=1392246 RepID=A0A6A5W7B6_9PLEO|nr:hypothetical protein P154DRAFT_306086 [Amniculicola lignicola CBS 123094]